MSERGESKAEIKGAWDLDILRSMPLTHAVAWLESQTAPDSLHDSWRHHALELLHYRYATENDDLQHFQLAFDSAARGLEIAIRDGVTASFVGAMVTNFITDAGHLELDIRHRLPSLRLLICASGDGKYSRSTWWNCNFYYFLNMRIVDIAQACLEQYSRCEDHEPDELSHMRANIAGMKGDGIRELSRLKQTADGELLDMISRNIRWFTKREFKPLKPLGARDYNSCQRPWLDRVLDRNMDALALTLDVLKDSGDPRLALAVENLRQCNELLDLASARRTGDNLTVGSTRGTTDA